MDSFEIPDIQEVPLQSSLFRSRVQDFLERNGLRMEALDHYYTIQGADGKILAGAGLAGDIIKCVAVDSAERASGLTVPLISRVVSEAASRGLTALKVFTKPEYEQVFESLGFHTIASAPLAVLMENGRGLEEYCERLRSFRTYGSCGLVVINANPFTLGHKYLLDTAAARVDRLFVIPVGEEGQQFSYDERRRMISKAAPGGAEVLDASSYQISAATFPNYFIKEWSEISETQIRLDLDLFGRHIAPALRVLVRFIGSEPEDTLTARYNALMSKILPQYGVSVMEIPRLETDGAPVSASRVRSALNGGSLSSAAALTPSSSHPFLLSQLAYKAMQTELETPLKPGLVGPDSNGAHTDMSLGLMQKGLSAIRPFLPGMAAASSVRSLTRLGIDAEEAMLAATGGVNTHRGAIYALGMALNAAGQLLLRDLQGSDIEQLMQTFIGQISREQSSSLLMDEELDFTPESDASRQEESNGSAAVRQYGVKGARQMAMDGYSVLFSDWLPFYRSLSSDKWRLQKTLLRIISTLDDTCVIHRVGYKRAQEVKIEAAGVLSGFSPEALEELCSRYASERISPGGAADMLALTVFIESILN
ncbi:MAG: triphosphoribosyl-dephospho-CoA synthase [Bacteroidales bacterium]|nr:triphosphoribosyl-dephospho-CoA synthase [Bacteroidales bacterium]